MCFLSFSVNICSSGVVGGATLLLLLPREAVPEALGDLPEGGLEADSFSFSVNNCSNGVGAGGLLEGAAILPLLLPIESLVGDLLPPEGVCLGIDSRLGGTGGSCTVGEDVVRAGGRGGCAGGRLCPFFSITR